MSVYKVPGKGYFSKSDFYVFSFAPLTVKCFRQGSCGGGGIDKSMQEKAKAQVKKSDKTTYIILKFKHRQFFLFNDLLVYGNIVINKKKYNKQVGLFYTLKDVITTQFAAFNSLGRSEIKILGG